jgi:hypothetical protein
MRYCEDLETVRCCKHTNGIACMHALGGIRLKWPVSEVQVTKEQSEADICVKPLVPRTLSHY